MVFARDCDWRGDWVGDTWVVVVDVRLSGAGRGRAAGHCCRRKSVSWEFCCWVLRRKLGAGILLNPYPIHKCVHLRKHGNCDWGTPRGTESQLIGSKASTQWGWGRRLRTGGNSLGPITSNALNHHQRSYSLSRNLANSPSLQPVRKSLRFQRRFFARIFSQSGWSPATFFFLPSSTNMPTFRRPPPRSHQPSDHTQINPSATAIHQKKKIKRHKNRKKN